jgi:hypothetical protein
MKQNQINTGHNGASVTFRAFISICTRRGVLYGILPLPAICDGVNRTSGRGSNLAVSARFFSAPVP